MCAFYFIFDFLIKTLTGCFPLFSCLSLNVSCTIKPVLLTWLQLLYYERETKDCMLFVFEWRCLLISPVLRILSSSTLVESNKEPWWLFQHHFWSETKLLQHLLLPWPRYRWVSASPSGQLGGGLHPILWTVWVSMAMWGCKREPPCVMRWKIWDQRQQWQQGLGGAPGYTWVTFIFSVTELLHMSLLYTIPTHTHYIHVLYQLICLIISWSSCN